MNPQQNRYSKVNNLLRNYAFMMGCYFIFFMILGFLNAVFPQLDFEKYHQSGLFKLMDENPLQFAFMAVIIAPILEEGVFRSLLKPTITELYVFIYSILFLLGFLFIPAEAHWLLKYGVLFLSISLVFLFIKSAVPVSYLQHIKLLLHKHYFFIWLLTSVLFGLVHIGNYVQEFEFNLLLFLLVFPRIIAGFFFGKVKIENRHILWSIIMHALNNGIILLFLLPKILQNYLT